jgi:glycosyltransferase involved in cell wall biosynthesis
MRVAIDTRSLRPPLTGIGHFVHRLMNALLPLLAPDEKLLSFNGWRIEPLDVNFLARIEGLNLDEGTARTLPSAASRTLTFLRQNHLMRNAIRAFYASRFHGAEKQLDLFHAVRYVPPGAFHKPVLPIIYDLSHIRYPQAHPRERVETLERQLTSLTRVPYVQTISEFSKSEIVSVLGISPDRIYVTYPAPSAHFQPQRDGDNECLDKYGLAAKSYFLFVGTREPRKNLKSVAEAYATLTAEVMKQFPLIWVGPSGWGDLELSSAAERARRDEQIRIVGYAPDRELAALYRNTVLFVMPSIYEGFGMPVIEAMACGAPIAASRIPVFEEIAGSYARYVDPMDIEGWRKVLKDVINGESGPYHGHGAIPDLTRFSWQTSAATTLELYRRLVRAN